jgi:hypothetical protein
VLLFRGDACACAAPVHEQQAFAGEHGQLSWLLPQPQQG